MAGSNGKIISEGTWGNNSILEKPVNIEIFNSIYFVDQMSGHRASDISKHEQYKKVEGGGDKDQAGELGDTPDQQQLEVHEVTREDNFQRASSGESASETCCRSSCWTAIREQSLWGPIR